MFDTIVVDVEQSRSRGRGDMIDEYLDFFAKNADATNYVSVLIIRGLCTDASLEFDSEGRLVALLSRLRALQHLTFRDIALFKSPYAPEYSIQLGHIKTVCLEGVTDLTGKATQYFFQNVKFRGTLSVQSCKIPKYLGAQGQADFPVNVEHVHVEHYFELFTDFSHLTNLIFPRLRALTFDVTGVTRANANRYNQPGLGRGYYGRDVHRNMTRFLMKHGEGLTFLRLDVSRVDLMHEFGESICHLLASRHSAQLLMLR